jgi:hypothetical protein
MARPGPLYCVTDKELYDALMSSKQQFNAGSLLDLARRRGILLSSADDRAGLADRLSAMIFGYEDIQAIQAVFETAGRGEKTTSFRLNTALTQDDVKQIAEEYRESAGEEEKVVTRSVGPNGYAVDLEYTEIDFSKTRLRQRQTREAHIEFRIEGDHTIVTLPATEKARQAAQSLRDRLFARKQVDIGLEEVDFSGITDPEPRTAFFTKLISSLSDFTLSDVMRVNADRADKPHSSVVLDEEGEEEEVDEEASEQMLGIVKAMAFQGQGLLTSPQYQAMHDHGFFITSITWSAKRNVSPYQIVEFEAGFEESATGRGFRYNVRGWNTQRSGEYTKNPKPVPPEDKKNFLSVVERVAIDVFRDIRQQFASGRDPLGGSE